MLTARSKNSASQAAADARRRNSWKVTTDHPPRHLGGYQDAGGTEPWPREWHRRSGKPAGVALVATLIMLSLVTFMTVAFLGVARRERRAVQATLIQGEARALSEAASAHAQAYVVSRMLSFDDKFNYSYHVTTNYSNPTPTWLVPDATNVHDELAIATGNWLTHLGNLQLDPRAPVFDPRFAGGWEAQLGRFYLDLNRNRLFEGTTNDVEVGDPQWIALLEYPDVPHGPTNRFIGRYAYAVLPAGLSLDLNFTHNQSKRLGAPSEGFLRNRGVGTWEINLAGFLAGLNPNASAAAGFAWDYQPGGYNYGAAASSPASAFNYALQLLAYRQTGTYANLESVDAAYGAASARVQDTLMSYDLYGDDVPVNQNQFLGTSTYSTANPWSGGRNTHFLATRYNDISELFETGRSYNNFVAHLTSLSTNTIISPAGTYDRYTYYRLLAQLGVDSAAPRGKFSVNFTNDFNATAESGTNFINWTPLQFFTNIGQALLDASVKTNVFTNAPSGQAPGGLFTNYFVPGLFFGAQPYPDNPVFSNIFGTNVVALQFTNTTLKLTNIMLRPYNRYTPEVHRVLQLTANIYDATSSNMFSAVSGPPLPAVYRPTIGYVAATDTVYIDGYVAEVDTTWLSYPYVDLQDANSIALNLVDGSNPNVLIKGLPVIIGAKKGYPNFNEFSARNFVAVTRKLEFVKTNINDIAPSFTNHMFIVAVSNQFGIEAWNSYFASFPRPLRLEVTNTMTYVMTNEFGPIMSNTVVVGGAESIPANGWPGLLNIANFRTPIFTNLVLLPPSAYATNYGTMLLPDGTTVSNFVYATTNYFTGSTSNASYFPDITLAISFTNWVTCTLIDTSVNPNRVVDHANLANLIGHMDLMQMLVGGTNQYNTNLTAGLFWITNRVDGTLNPQMPTVGISNQVYVAISTNFASVNNWRQWSADIPIPYRIDEFRRFLGLPSNSRFRPSPKTRMQAPFSPTVVAMQNLVFEVNDPLVHYNNYDLEDGSQSRLVITNQFSTNLFNNNYIVLPFASFQIPEPPGSLGNTNRAYRPWGGNPLLGPSFDAFNLAVKDPGIRRSDDWDFPQRKWANVGWIGRVHRGTPWQTFYLKSALPASNVWFNYAHSAATYPTNDWKLLDPLSAHLNEHSARGLLDINQTNYAAWSAMLGGVIALTNVIPGGATNFGPFTYPNGAAAEIVPNTPQMYAIHQGIVRTHLQRTNFSRLGMICSVPELSGGSPYLNIGAEPWYPTVNYNVGRLVAFGGQFFVANNANLNQPPPNTNFWSYSPWLSRELAWGLTDPILERIPQQILGLLTVNHAPRIVVYAYGQALKPAEQATYLFPGPYQGMVTNYQINGEMATRTVLRIEGLPEPGLIPAIRPNNYPAVFPRMVVEDFKIIGTD